MDYEIKFLQDMIESKKKDRHDLINQHGTGVRPSWVSTDLAILDHWIMALSNELNEMQNKEQKS
jgi:hypothetical protein